MILASDGLDTITLKDIETIIDKNKNKSADFISSKLLTAVDLAKAPNQDNASVVVVSLSKGFWF